MPQWVVAGIRVLGWPRWIGLAAGTALGTWAGAIEEVYATSPWNESHSA